jgi:hypothetical protein
MIPEGRRDELRLAQSSLRFIYRRRSMVSYLGALSGLFGMVCLPLPRVRV